MKRFLVLIVQTVVLLALSVGIFRVCADLYTQHNGFAVMYHPDEWSKAGQLLNNERNFNHPQLMLEAAQLVVEREQIAGDTASVTIAGRRTSAYLAALAAVFMAWAGWFAARWLGFVLAAIGAGLCPALLSHAHYFKEDASLCCGVAAVVCFAAAMSVRRHWSIMLLLSLLLGGACGLAASGKYAGAVMVAPALLIVLASTFGRWLLMPLCPLLLAGGAYWTWITINYRATEAWEEFMIGFRTETDHAFTEHSGITMSKPNGYFAQLVWDEAMPHVRLLLIATPILLLTLGLLRRRRRLASLRDSIKLADAGPHELPVKPVPKPDRADRYPSLLFGWWLLLTVIIYTAALSWSVIPFYRYALPSTFMLYTLAAIAVAWVASLIGRPWWLRGSVAVIGVAALAAVQWARCADYNGQFANDSRDQLPLWIANTLTGNPRIVADGYTELGASGSYISETVRPAVMRYRWAAEAGSISELRQRGVQYVVIASPSYERWINPHGRALEGYEDDFRQKSQFYTELFGSYPIVMQWKARHPMQTFTNPDMTVFQIDKGPIAQKPENPQNP